ncbi:MAG: thioredoxin domain-containing protein [Candidatus Bathyarchaeia archaeon]|nr:hypothetical protein [Candidatus Bathyarchaeota archaeon]
MEEKKIEIIYFYSSLYESKRSLLPIVKKLRRARKNLNVRLINVDEPENVDLVELYNVNSVPLMIFLTPKGEVASRKSISLSEEGMINDIVDRVIKGDLPKPHVDGLRRRILESLKSVSRRNELTQLMIEQIEGDLLEADSEDDIHEIINLHISMINHTIRDLEEVKKALRAHLKGSQSFIV